MTHERVKKPFYKRWWVWLLALIVIIALTQCGDDETIEPANETKTEDTTLSNQTEEQDEATNETSDEEEQQVEEEDEDTQIKAGTYKIGTDLPAGEYLVFADSTAYIESASDSTGELDSILFNDNLPNGAHSYVTLNEGEYFKLQGGHMYPVDSAPSVVPDDGLYENGMYKVGQDIPAGEYKVILDSTVGMGYLEVAKDSRHQIDSIVTNENVQADMYITISEGQYIKLQDVKIQK
ncbi:hypothetical protein [Robertmurraya kyonggiensis]|uniref:Uncharacterized protein n=1 Tax=Robertmurraya kyonggiensis TaxID=1037680 RepID=A0A4U1CYV7_9BACI|nr:hypothetical protein [Robertmurraya kyonggiensis]TKC14384.1 hypothetical protein FA727_21740 [Robertmurraya kyonggiensis]